MSFLSSTLIPAGVLPHFEAVCDFMKSLPPEGAQEVGEFFKRYGDVLAGAKRDRARMECIASALAKTRSTAFGSLLWAMRIEPTDENVMMAAPIFERFRRIRLGLPPAPST